MTNNKEPHGIKEINVRFFILDYSGEEGAEHKEVSSTDFDASKGVIEYKQHSVFENGCRQICLTKVI